MRALRHVLVAALVFALTAPGLAYRDLWQDEVETAERARTILESGYPRVIDRSGAVSLNTGGWELEDGVAHRYSPWVQFYWAAAGLAPARALGLSQDAGLRVPFVAAHAATSGLVSLGLEAAAGLSPLAAAALGVAVGVQTVRVAHDRTARYHALLDMWVVVGLLGVGLLATRRRTGLALVAAAILVLPHVQTLAGSAFALTVGVAALVRLLQLSPGRPGAALGTAAACAALPGLVSLVLLLVLTRPWRQTAWYQLPTQRLYSLRDLTQVGYAVYFGLAALAVLVWKRRFRQAIPLAAALGTVALTVRLLDLHPFSQTRYYLGAVFFGLLWPVYAGLEGWTDRGKRTLAWILAGVVLLPEATGSASGDPFRPFHGVRLAWSDAAKAGKVVQPLHQALALIRENAAPADPVLVDYVPQFANWYLPGHPIALMPEPFARTALNADNPVWTRVPPWPRWHVRYATIPVGPWICGGHCDYTIVAENQAEASYVLFSRRLGAFRKMCIVAAYPTEKWLNSPFRMLSRAAFSPEGDGSDLLTVAVACDGPASKER